MNKMLSLLLLAISSVSYADIQDMILNKHYDPNYMYNYRTGTTGNYTYNYNVEDVSASGVYGDCDMTGKYGFALL